MRTYQRALAVSGLAALTTSLAASAASAHVTATPDTAVPGSESKISFLVPNEEPKADTTKVEIDLPMDHPIAEVSVRPQPGWDVKVDKAKLATPIKSDDAEITQAVSKITWSGGTITPGQFQEFDVSLGPLPTNTDRLMFSTTQTYSDGTVVKWDQDPGNGGQEPEHPAPTLRLVAAAANGPAGPAKALPGARTTSSPSADDGTARLIGGIGLATGVIGVVIGGFGLTRRRTA